MPLPLPGEKKITIQFRSLPGQYSMPAMSMAMDHYTIGYTISGDRRSITPLNAYEIHAGDISISPPFKPHRTISASNEPYVSYLIKFSEEIKESISEQIGSQILEELFAQKICHFAKETQCKIEYMLHEMLEEYQKETSFQEIILQGMLLRLIVTIWENREAGGSVTFPTPLSEPILDAIAYIGGHFSQNISLEDAARCAHLSPAYFSRLFHAQLGMSFSDYISNVRIDHAKMLLAQSDKSITEIALVSGFCNGDYFSTQFKRKTGMTPSAFRKTL